MCYLRLTPRLGLSSWAAMYLLVREMKQEKILKLFSCHSHLSIACIITYQPVRPTEQIHAFLIYSAVECCL